MNKKFLLTFAILPMVLSGANFAHVTKAEETFTGKTFDYTTTENPNNIAYIDGRTLLKQLKYDDKTWDEINANPVISKEMDIINARYRVAIDDMPDEMLNPFKPFSYGRIEGNDAQQIPTIFYVEGYEYDDFVPKYVSVEGKSEASAFDAINFQRIASIEGVDSLDGSKIVYEHTITIDPFAANEIINAAYKIIQEQKEIQKKIDAHNAYEAYQAKVESYEEWKRDCAAAELKNDNIEAYETAREQYDTIDKPTYDTYINQTLPAYYALVEKYKQYCLEYGDYKANQDNGNYAKAEEAYNTGMTTVDNQLASMEYFYAGPETFPGVEVGGTIYSYIFRNAVNMVVDENNEFLFTAAGISRDIMSRARQSTNNLQKYLKNYNDLRVDKTEAGKKARYQYLIKNGKNIKDNLLCLTQCLEKFFNNTNVRNEMEKRERTQRYTFLLAELIYVSSLFTQNSFNTYDTQFSGSSSNSAKLNSATQLDGKPTNEILGVDALNAADLKPFTVLTSYPVTAESIYGTEPTLEQYGLAPSDIVTEGGVSKIREPEVVKEPIEPFLADYGLTDTNKVNKPLKTEYGIQDNDIENGKIKSVEKPNYAKPAGRDSQFDVLYNANISWCNEYLENEKIDIKVNREFNFDECNIARQEIAVMNIIVGDAPVIHEICFHDADVAPTLTHEIPPDADKAFNKWTDGVTVTDLQNLKQQSINIIADFVSLVGVTKYKIEWRDAESNVLLSTNYGYQGYRPFYTDGNNNSIEITPTKQPTDSAKYKFAGFTYPGQTIKQKFVTTKCELLPSNNDVITIFVHFDVESLYSVTFYDSDENNVPITNTNLGVKKGIEKGARAGHDNPETKEIKSGDYLIKRCEFEYWYKKDDSSLTPVELPVRVTEDLELVAHYKITKYYKVNFLDDDGGNQIYNADVGGYAEGDIVSTPSGLTKSFNLLENKYYAFDKFVDSNNQEISALTGDNSSTIIYHALYQEYSIIENATITEGAAENKLIITASQGTEELNFAKFNQLVGQSLSYGSLDIIFDNVKLELTNAQARQLYAKNVRRIKPLINSETNGDIKFNLYTTKADGEETQVEGISAVATLTGLPEADHIRAFVGDRPVQVTQSNGDIKFNVNGNEEVTLSTYYTLSFDAMSNATYKVNGVSVNAGDKLEFKKGSEITVEVNPTTGYEIDGINASGVAASETNTYTFTIGKDEKISADTSKIKFTVTIMVDNQVFKQEEVEYGSTYIVPDASKDSDDYYEYAFTGYEEFDSDDTKSIFVIGDVTLHATFEQKLIESVRDEELEKNRRIVTTILVAVLGTIGAGLLFLLFFIIFTKRKDDDDEDIDSGTNSKMNHTVKDKISK